MSFYSIAKFIQEYYPEYWGYVEYDAESCAIIRKVQDEWGIFCNFAKTPLKVNGYTFNSSEELFQLMKFKDSAVLKNIMAGITANDKKSDQIKMTAKSYEKKYRREDWGKMVIDAMKFCLQTKYDQCEEFRIKLIESSGYNIVEDQSSFTKSNPDAWGVKLKDGKFVGPNLLGRLLMELRDTGKLEYNLPDDAFEFIAELPKKSNES
jgi:ribA/ribD-fused uncharacterized protein